MHLFAVVYMILADAWFSLYRVPAVEVPNSSLKRSFAFFVVCTEVKSTFTLFHIQTKPQGPSVCMIKGFVGLR